eukprot:TRINITY_DN2546_c0_g1_i15.p3 TRINITY_DN2546_c0_g1~~TRINITY_DN2546_c0_g1_i15.p3  ORF type:complete len:243 (+),score=52.47 TRINITY_DN2546_c0_g1_i15:53-781(+)
MLCVFILYFFFFFFKQKTAYEMQRGLVGSEMCIRDRFYIVMNSFEGNTLSKIIKEKTLTLEQLRIIAWDIASALFEMNDKDFIHRDVKPDNIFLHTSNNKAILIDIDTARPSTEKNTGFGTAKYCAPEVRDEIQGTDIKKADIYSFGKVLEEMWNSLPSVGEEVKSDAMHLVGEEVKSDAMHLVGEEVKSDAMHLVNKCTASDYKSRLSILEVINHPFFFEIQQNSFSSSSLNGKNPRSENN